MTLHEELWNQYVANWRACLKGFLGWEPARVEEFVAKWETRFRESPSWFFHERPGWYLASWLVPQHVKESPNVDVLERRIERELMDLDRPWPPDDATLRATKERLRSILREYGADLPMGSGRTDN